MFVFISCFVSFCSTAGGETPRTRPSQGRAEQPGPATPPGPRRPGHAQARGPAFTLVTSRASLEGWPARGDGGAPRQLASPKPFAEFHFSLSSFRRLPSVASLGARRRGSGWRRMTPFWHRLLPCVLLGCGHRRRVRRLRGTGGAALQLWTTAAFHLL